MAATFTVEDGSGVENANAYVTTASADQYHEDHGGSTDWSTATTAVKEASIREATQYLDLVYGAKWKGQKAAEENGLDWPRLGADDGQGYLVDSDELPRALTDACSELALRAITETTGLLPDIANPGELKRLRVEVGQGAIVRDQTFVGGQSQIKRFRLVDYLVARIIEGGFTSLTTTGYRGD